MKKKIVLLHILFIGLETYFFFSISSFLGRSKQCHSTVPLDHTTNGNRKKFLSFHEKKKKTRMTLEDTVNLGRALSFSLLAPLQFFYGLWVGRFQTPYLFLLMLLSGYIFAVISSYLGHSTTIFSLYVMALFFIVVMLLCKIFFHYWQKTRK